MLTPQIETFLNKTDALDNISLENAISGNQKGLFVQMYTALTPERKAVIDAAGQHWIREVMNITGFDSRYFASCSRWSEIDRKLSKDHRLTLTPLPNRRIMRRKMILNHFKEQVGFEETELPF